jgi:hypothetical protein
MNGRAVAQAVRVRVAYGFCCGQSGIGAGFLRVLRFALPIVIPPISPSSYSPRAGIIGLLVAAVPSGPNWTPYQFKKIKKFIMKESLRYFKIVYHILFNYFERFRYKKAYTFML